MGDPRMQNRGSTGVGPWSPWTFLIKGLALAVPWGVIEDAFPGISIQMPDTLQAFWLAFLVCTQFRPGTWLLGGFC